MKTDSLFYELFRRWPAVALDLAGLDPATAERYEFRAEELKQAAFRLDGLLVPADASEDPYVFIEVQFQPDDSLYPRLFAELFLYLRRAPKPRDWRVLVLYPDLAVERIPRGYELPVSLPLIHRLDLSALDGQDRATPGWELLRLIVDETPNALDRARRLLRTPATGPHDPALINFIETILVYKLPRSTREEIQAMLGITDIDLKQTQFYKDVFAEGERLGEQRGEQRGEQLGEQRGEQRGRQQEAASLLRRQLTRRFGPLPDWAEQRLQTAPLAELESWAERVLDATTLEAVWTETGH